MMGEPKTALEFQRAGIWVERDCAACLGKSLIEPNIIVMMYGDDFDMRANIAELGTTLTCPLCGTKYPDIRFVSRSLEREADPATEADLEWDDRKSA